MKLKVIDFRVFEDPKGISTKNVYDTSFKVPQFFQYTYDSFFRMLSLPGGSRTAPGDSGGPMVLFTTPKSPLKRFCIKKSGGGEGPCLFGIHSKRNVSWGTTTVVTNLPTLASQAGWDIWQ